MSVCLQRIKFLDLDHDLDCDPDTFSPCTLGKR